MDMFEGPSYFLPQVNNVHITFPWVSTGSRGPGFENWMHTWEGYPAQEQSPSYSWTESPLTETSYPGRMRVCCEGQMCAHACIYTPLCAHVHTGSEKQLFEALKAGSTGNSNPEKEQEVCLAAFSH